MGKLRLLVLLGLAAVASLPAAAAYDGPIDQAERAADDACEAKVCPLNGAPRTVYRDGLLVSLAPSNARDGGRVVYVSPPTGSAVIVERHAGTGDGFTLRTTQARFTAMEPSDDGHDPYGSVSGSVMSNAWFTARLAPDTGSHEGTAGWNAWPTSGSVGETDGDAWYAACAAVRCQWGST